MLKEFGVSIIQMVFCGDINLCKSYMGVLNNKKRNEAVQEFILLEKALSQEMNSAPNVLVLTKHGIDFPTYKRYERKFMKGATVPMTDSLTKEEFDIIHKDFTESSLSLPTALTINNMKSNQLLYMSKILNQLSTNYTSLGFSKLKKYTSGEAYTIFGGRLTSIASILNKYKTIDKANTSLLSIESIKITDVLNPRSSTAVNRMLRTGMEEMLKVLSTPVGFHSKLSSAGGLPILTEDELADVLLCLAEVGFVGLDTLIGNFQPPKTKAELIENIGPKDKIGLTLLQRELESKIYFGGN